jgi:hypothetical protein
MRAALRLAAAGFLAFFQLACQAGEAAEEAGARANLLTRAAAGDAGAGDLAIAIEVEEGCDEPCLEGERCDDGSCEPVSYVARGECWGGEGRYGSTGASRAQCELECNQFAPCAGYSWHPDGEGLSNTYNCWLIAGCEAASDQSSPWQTFCHDTEVCFNP